MTPARRQVLVVGGSRGIGKAVAAAFVQAGCDVAIAARNRDEVAATAAALGATGLICDVSDAVQVEQAISALPSVDVVVNAAAVQGGRGAIGPLWDTEPASFARVIEINLVGTYNVLRSAIRHMRPRRSGTVILFSGGGSTAPRPGFDAYGASKTAVLRLAESTQAALAAEGSAVRVFAVAPGAVATTMTQEILENIDLVPQEAAAASGVAEGKGGVPATMAADLCVFLSGEDSSPLAGRLVHVRESYRDYVRRGLGDDDGRLRRIGYSGG